MKGMKSMKGGNDAMACFPNFMLFMSFMVQNP